MATNPPPLKIPAVTDPALQSYLRQSRDAIYQLWYMVGGGTGIIPITSGGTGGDTASDARTNLGLAIGTDVQAYDAGLASIAGLTTSADKAIYTTASDTYATFSLTARARANAAVSTLTGVLVGNGTGADTVAVSGTDIKTINSTSLLGSGDITVGGMWKYITTISLSADATIDIEQFDSTYDAYCLVSWGLALSGSDQIYIRLKIGGSYITSSTYYRYNFNSSSASPVAFFDALSSPSTDISLELKLFDVNGSGGKTVWAAGSGFVSPTAMASNRACYNSTTGTLSGVRIYTNGGATMTGDIHVFGMLIP